MQCACAILSSVACPAVQIFSHFLINGKIFRRHLLKNMSFFFLCISSETFLTLRRMQRDTITKIHSSSCEVQIFCHILIKPKEVATLSLVIHVLVNLSGRIQNLVIILFLVQQPASGPGPPHSRDFYITHNEAPHSVELPWTRDQLVVVTSTCQHATLVSDKHPCP
jgi:hypothetical protein